MYRSITLAVILVLSTAADAQELNSAAYGLAYNSGGMDLQWDGKSLIPTFTQLSDGYIFTYGAAATYSGITLNLDPIVVPEPASATLLLLGFSGLLWRRRKRYSQNHLA